MASKSTYECYICKKNGFPETRVYLDGKTSDGKTIYKNEDMTPHQHRQQQVKQQSQQQPLVSEKVTEQSVQGGITAFSMVTDLIKLEEQTHLLLSDIGHKLDRLLNLAERK